MMGKTLANAIRPKPSIRGLRPGTEAARPRPSAASTRHGNRGRSDAAAVVRQRNDRLARPECLQDHHGVGRDDVPGERSTGHDPQATQRNPHRNARRHRDPQPLGTHGAAGHLLGLERHGNERRLGATVVAKPIAPANA